MQVQNIQIIGCSGKNQPISAAKITFALVADVAVILGDDIASRVLHERLVNNLLVVVGALFLP